ncbi:MAG: hypothetical protein DWQ31_11870 [Planctomycetota bacterium]|nr:MAG: hypothetical protein DWQ31_11870 [Planctomycetota bacterium]REK17633.1 MAG: hypothetical protein DWQ37_05920 [Planctomycetota bacterium]REK18037.1 MAG: hypothetical protein DWQ42_21130 [Planctomycetota bacterium]REK42336.1 MAG: hypothetical protein DWQ46_13790 [Planctomycetota bacterium]
MNYRDRILDRLAAARVWGYHADQPAASEPTATAALALSCAGRDAAARAALDWLVRVQGKDGSVGVTATEALPAWPTALAVLAFAAAGNRYDGRRQLGVDHLLSIRGTPVDRNEQMGHDSTLVGWPWVLPTHSWSEPTALALLALRAAGHGRHPRADEATRLLVDRLLPAGGSNYGNTRVLNQMLRPHVMPTGVVLWALADRQAADSRIGLSLDFLTTELEVPTSAVALGYSVLALAAHGRDLGVARRAYQEVAARHLQQPAASPWKLAVLALAALEMEPSSSLRRPTQVIAEGASS